MGHSQVYDYLIIGGGPSGLYCAKRIEDKLQRDNDTSIMILEKNRTLGGRTRTVTFHGQRVYTGAGVGRYHKDRILKSLVKQCSGTLWSWHSKICFDFKNPVDTMVTKEPMSEIIKNEEVYLAQEQDDQVKRFQKAALIDLLQLISEKNIYY